MIVFFKSLVLIFVCFATTNVKSQTVIKVEKTPAVVALGEIIEDGSRVSIEAILKNPIVSIINRSDFQLVSYDLTLNINGTIYIRPNIKSATLNAEELSLLKEVDDDMREYNKLYIENVKYRRGDEIFKLEDILYLLLSE